MPNAPGIEDTTTKPEELDFIVPRENIINKWMQTVNSTQESNSILNLIYFTTLDIENEDKNSAKVLPWPQKELRL